MRARPGKCRWMKKACLTTRWFRIKIEIPFNWHRIHKQALIALVLIGFVFLPGCTDMGRVMFGPDVHDDSNLPKPWPKPDCVGLTTAQCCNLDTTHQQMCQTLHIGGY